MADPNDPPHYETDRVRAGATPHMTRYILAISLTLIVVIYAVYLLI
ncbi:MULTISPECIES: hypothetical protein [unclassified Sphingomonas]|nr:MULTISPECIES: hypothetical protein [unclassified Sphingomonas]MCR5871744.1 hypothetical protein [Sphingomonas sp. J344]UUX99969.1 hypothetical protein LRS08_02140 [Sphingomonas sp. J315]